MPIEDKPFFDTNVLIYVASGDIRKAEISDTLLAQGGTISVQVLNEFVSVSRRKYAIPFEGILEMLAKFRALLTVTPLTVNIHDRGVWLAQRHNFAIYDAMIVAAAQLSGCRTLYSEDMHAGHVLDGLRIVNPYS